jgi:uncharacterized RDD family membrane protein YckC
VGAALIDGLIVILLALPVGLVLGLAGAGEGYLGNIAGIVVGWLYFALMESSEKQATLGKQALGIQVTGLDGERITFGRATGRHFAKWLSSITLGIGYIMAAFTERKQCLHDMVANCLVVNR